MKTIEIDGLIFELLISKSEISKKVHFLSSQLLKKYNKKWPLCLIVLNGAAVFAHELLENIKISVDVSLVKVHSYEGLDSTNKITVDHLPYKMIKNRDILLIEDIVDSGLTLDFLKKELIANGAQKVECVTLLFKPSKYQCHKGPDFVGFQIGEEFVVGYGMDFNEKGRTLINIYKNIIDKN